MTITQHTKRRIFAALATTAAAAGTFMVATPAQAATPRNGVCEYGEFCYYAGWSAHGSVSDFTTSVRKYGTSQPRCYEFKSRGTGQGQCIFDNANSVWNRSNKNVYVYYEDNNNQGHPNMRPKSVYQTIRPGQIVNLTTVRHHNRSHAFAGYTRPPNCQPGRAC